MAKSESRKPRIANLRSVTLMDQLPIAQGSASYRRAENCVSLIADYDSQVIKIRMKAGGTYIIPFIRCKYWQPDVGMVSVEDKAVLASEVSTV